jgi:apolipoprotein N-acyltransferase
MRLKHLVVAVGLACVSGGLLVVSFPPFKGGLVAWVALVPLLILLEGRGPWAAFALAYLAGLVFITGSFYWIWWVPGYNLLDELLLGGYLAFYVAAWGLGLTWIRRRTALPVAVVAPVLWVALEYIRSNLGFLSLPWMLLGHTQHASLPIIQIASITGVYGLTFLIVLVNVALTETIRHVAGRMAPSRRADAAPSPIPWGALGAATLLLVATWLYGLRASDGRTAEGTVAVALVHTNVPRAQRWDMARRRSILERNEALTREATGTAPQLIVWPETAVPGDVEHHAPLKQRVSQAAREAKATLLVGSSELAKFSDRRLLDRSYNSMYLFSPAGEIVGQYRKIALVPFGEYEPLHGVVRWPKAIAAAMGTHLAGDRYTVFTLGPVPFSTVICWEIVFPDLVRRFVRNGARFIVNASNEAWFAGSAVPDQMLAMSVFRAVENRAAVARSANLGISSIIDPHGRVTHRVAGPSPGGAATDGVLAGHVALGPAGTFYTRHGDVFAWACLTASLAVVAGACVPSIVGSLLGGRVPRPSSASR